MIRGGRNPLLLDLPRILWLSSFHNAAVCNFFYRMGILSLRSLTFFLFLNLNDWLADEVLVLFGLINLY